MTRTNDYSGYWGGTARSIEEDVRAMGPEALRPLAERLAALEDQIRQWGPIRNRDLTDEQRAVHRARQLAEDSLRRHRISLRSLVDKVCALVLEPHCRDEDLQVQAAARALGEQLVSDLRDAVRRTLSEIGGDR